MASPSLEDLCIHISAKIATIKKYLLLRDAGEDQCLKSMISKIGNEVVVVHDLLRKMEAEVKEQEKLKSLLKNIQKAVERDQKEAQDLLDGISHHLPKPTESCTTVPTVKHEEQAKAVEPEPAKKPEKEKKSIKAVPLITKEEFESVPATTVPTVKHEEQAKAVEPEPAKKPEKEKKNIKEVPLITIEEFESVPTYMKGRLTCDQINAIVQEINKAVVGKYKIMYRPLKSMSVPVRNLYQRFVEEETKDTKGKFFVVEADIREFTELKLDKRFHNIISILRHCHRVRDVRSAGLVRYIIY